MVRTRSPVVVCEGAPFEVGAQLGARVRERVAHTVRAYFAMFGQAGLARTEVLAHAEGFVASIAAFARELLEEMRGIAEGSGHDLRATCSPWSVRTTS